MQRAQAVMGIQHRWLGYQDSGLPEEGEIVAPGSFATIPLEISALPLVRIIREYRPQVLITYDENGGYPHPDHIRTHEISLFAMEAAADPTRYPEAGEPWQVSKVYYDRIISSARIRAIHKYLTETMPDSPMIEAMEGMKRWMDDAPDLSTTHIPAGDFFEIRDAALKSHASQVAPDSFFFFWPNDLQREVWPTEDFQLVSSTVESELPESDLFAGIPEKEDA
jgi:mycothiol S-conjugate amidase